MGVGVPWAADPVKMTIIRNMETPRFAGTNEDWSRCVVEWQKYLSKLGQGMKLSDRDRLSLLENCLDETNKKE